MLNDNTLILLQIMATASVGARDQISHTCGRHTMRLYYERKTSAQDLYAKDLFLARIHLWVSFLPTSENDANTYIGFLILKHVLYFQVYIHRIAPNG